MLPADEVRKIPQQSSRGGASDEGCHRESNADLFTRRDVRLADVETVRSFQKVQTS
jgi:hypothetical protein